MSSSELSIFLSRWYLVSDPVSKLKTFSNDFEELLITDELFAIDYDIWCCFSLFCKILGTRQSLAQSAQSQLPMALAPSTRRSYCTMFRTFLAFLIFCNVPSHQVNVTVLLAFFECLVVNKVKHSQLLNYLSAIKTLSSTYDLHIHDFNHTKLHMYLRSIQKSAPFSVKWHHIIDIQLLTSIVNKYDSTYLGYIFKTCYLIAFFWIFQTV